MTGKPGDEAELKMIEQVKAYFLTPGTIVQVTEEDPSRRAIKNPYGRDYGRSLDLDPISQQACRQGHLWSHRNP